MLTLRSRTFPSTRTVRVFVPAGYETAENATTQYPAFVFTDGLMVFRTEKLPAVASVLERERKIRPTIFVGVDNGTSTENPHDEARSNEYLPYPDLPTTTLMNPHGKLFPKFLFEDVMPLVRARYRVSDEPIGLGGFSYGALAALWAAMSRPGEISRLLLESGPLQISHDRLIRDAHAVERWPRTVDIGVGTAETGDAAFDQHGVVLSAELARIIRARGSRVRLVVDQDAQHDPAAWAARLPSALRFLATP
jgi:enterochelin esterase-like enzyme